MGDNDATDQAGDQATGEYTVEARELLRRDEIDLIDVDAGERRITKVSGLAEGDVWLQYRDEGEPRPVAAHARIRVRPAT